MEVGYAGGSAAFACSSVRAPRNNQNSRTQATEEPISVPCISSGMLSNRQHWDKVESRKGSKPACGFFITAVGRLSPRRGCARSAVLSGFPELR
jgi:hypothetical protein